MSINDGGSRPLTENEARSSEIELMRGRLSHLACQGYLTARERIGVCLAQEILDARYGELRARQ